MQEQLIQPQSVFSVEAFQEHQQITAGITEIVLPAGVSSVETTDTNFLWKWLKRNWYTIRLIFSSIGTIAAIQSCIHQGISVIDLSLFAVMFIFSAIGGEMGLHRLFAHKSYEVGKALRVGLAIAASTAGEVPLIDYAAFHRHHHATADTVNDSHSPYYIDSSQPYAFVRNLWHAFLGWRYNDQTLDRATPEKYAKDLLAEPELVLIHNAFYWIVLASLLVPAGLGWLLTGTVQGAWTAFLWAGMFRLFLLMILGDVVIRICCHIMGDRPFVDQATSHSRNIELLAIPTLGAALHNNHHAFPGSALTNLAPGQIDLSGLLITALEKVGLAWNVKRPTQKQIESKQS